MVATFKLRKFLSYESMWFCGEITAMRNEPRYRAAPRRSDESALAVPSPWTDNTTQLYDDCAPASLQLARPVQRNDSLRQSQKRSVRFRAPRLANSEVWNLTGRIDDDDDEIDRYQTPQTSDPQIVTIRGRSPGQSHFPCRAGTRTARTALPGVSQSWSQSLRAFRVHLK